jgi:hypothetical protein
MRQSGIANAISMLEKLITDYMDPKPHCSCPNGSNFKCDAMVLGALIKRSMEIGLWPIPPLSSISTSFHHLEESIRCMEIPIFCDSNRIGYYNPNYNRGGCCNIKGLIEVSLTSIEDQLCGLDLDTFKVLNQL